MAPQPKSYEDALEFCRERGMRLSKQRQFILKLLWDTNEHLTAGTIYHRLRQQDKKSGINDNFTLLVRMTNKILCPSKFGIKVFLCLGLRLF